MNMTVRPSLSVWGRKVARFRVFPDGLEFKKGYGDDIEDSIAKVLGGLSAGLAVAQFFDVTFYAEVAILGTLVCAREEL